jgi:hypothetical protein
VTKQGSPQALNGQVPAIDLDAQLEAIDLSPRPVKLGGVTYQVRRDLTGAEVAEFYRYLNAGKDVESLAILVGDDSVALHATMEKLPRARMNQAVKVILQTAGLQVQVAGEQAGEPGEASAS